MQDCASHLAFCLICKNKTNMSQINMWFRTPAILYILNSIVYVLEHISVSWTDWSQIRFFNFSARNSWQNCKKCIIINTVNDRQRRWPEFILSAPFHISAFRTLNAKKRKASRFWLKTALIASWFDVLSVSLRSQGRKDTIYLVGWKGRARCLIVPRLFSCKKCAAAHRIVRFDVPEHLRNGVMKCQ